MDEDEKPILPAMERHYSVFEIAKIWNLSHMTVRRLFDGEPGVLAFGSEETRYGRKRTTLRIPESVLIRVHEKFSTRTIKAMNDREDED